MPQWPATGKTRGVGVTKAGGPKAPLKPLPRVSASRHGGIATKAIGGGVGTAARGSETLWAYELVPGEAKHTSTRPSKTCRWQTMHFLEKTGTEKGSKGRLYVSAWRLVKEASRIGLLSPD